MARGRWRRRAALGLLGVASGLALLLYYYYAHTRLGLEQARERLQQRLQRTLPGLRIGRLVSWSIGGQVVLANVSVREPGGRAELHVEQVQLDLEPRSLWSDTIRIDRLQIRAPRVYVARDPAGLVRSSQRAGRSSGVAVGALEITDGAIELATARGIIAARRVTGRASFGAERVSAQLENAEWEGLTPGAPVKLRGTAAGPYDRIAVALSLDGAGGATGALDGYFARDGSYELSARTNGIPLQALGAQQPGRVQGIAQVRGRDRRAEVTLDLSGSSIADMAVEAAHASARFDGARWQLMSADLGAPGLALRAAGSGDGLTIALDIDGTIDERSALAHRLSELAGLRDLRARSRVHARVAGRLPGPLEMRGSLQASQLAFAGLLVAPADATFEVGGWPRATHGHAHLEARGPRWGGIATPVDSIALDLAMPGDASFRLRGTGTGARGRAALVAHGVASQHAIRAMLDQLAIDFASALGPQSIVLRAPATVRVVPGRSLELAETSLQLLGGDARARAKISTDTAGRAHVEADLTARGATLFGLPVPTAALHAELGRAVLHTRLDAEVGRSATPVHGQASLPIAQWQGAIALDLSARGLPVGDLPAPMRLDGRLAGGALDLAVTVRGERTHPITHADLKVQKVRVSGLADLDGSLALDAFGGVTHLVGELLVDGTRALSVRGQAQLDPGDLISEPGRHRWREAPLELALEAPRFDLSRLRQQMGLRGLVSGRGTMNGTLGHPVGRAHFAVEGASWGGLAWSRMGIDSTLDGWLWRTDFAADQLGGGRLDARLTVDPVARPRVRADLHARRLDIGVLRDFIPQLREVAGELGADLSVVGLFAAERQVSGAVTLTHGRVRPVGLRALQDVDLALSIHPGRCDITRLQAHSGGGTLHGQGSAELVGLHPRSVHLNATATQFLVGYGGFASGQLDGDLVVDAVTTPDLLSTRVRLEHGAIALPALETGRSLHRVGPLADVRFVDRAAARERADAHPVRIDLTLEVPDALHVSGRDIDADLHGGFALTGDGTGGRRATGMVEIQRGHVQVFGQRFEIERARMRWAGGPPGNPALDVRVSRQLPDALLVVALHGTLDRPELALSSDPPSYDQNQLASMVLSGQPPPAAPSASGSSANSVSAAGTISSAVLGQVIAQIAPALPVDVVRIDVAQDTTPAGAATGASTTKRYEVGKHLGDRIYVSYVRVAGAQQNQSGNEAHFEFRLRRQWVLESAIGDAGEGGLDLFWTYRY